MLSSSRSREAVLLDAGERRRRVELSWSWSRPKRERRDELATARWESKLWRRWLLLLLLDGRGTVAVDDVSGEKGASAGSDGNPSNGGVVPVDGATCSKVRLYDGVAGSFGPSSAPEPSSSAYRARNGRRKTFCDENGGRVTGAIAAALEAGDGGSRERARVLYGAGVSVPVHSVATRQNEP